MSSWCHEFRALELSHLGWISYRSAGRAAAPPYTAGIPHAPSTRLSSWKKKFQHLASDKAEDTRVKIGRRAERYLGLSIFASDGNMIARSDNSLVTPSLWSLPAR